MTQLKIKTAGVMLLLLSMAVAPFAVAQTEGDVPSNRNDESASEIPEDTPPVAIQADGTPLSTVLKEICRKARWGLVLNASPEVLNAPVTVLLPQKKPAGEVVKMVLLQKPLRAHVENGVLHVVDTPPPPASTPAESTPDENAVQSESPSSDTDSRDIVINGFDELKKFKGHFKEKFKEHKKNGRGSNDRKIERVEIGQAVHIGPDEAVHKAVSIGDNVTIEGSVQEEAVAVGGQMVVKKGAHIGTDAVAIGGDVRIESGAFVEGEAVAVGGKVIVEEGATVQGDRVSVNVPLPSIGGLTGVLGMGALFWVLAAVLRSFVILAVALIIVWLAPSRVKIAQDY
ncbi:MAG: hypothetical protein JXX29_15845, partial [Deltaproteobacteria bacterium]|nr:hypothetical protein [Deltaproteobacteria bacterium]